MKKVLSLVLVLAMVLGSFSFVSAATPNGDVVGTVYEPAVARLALLGILEGYPDGSFKPENQITRAEFAAVAIRAKGLNATAQAAKGLATGFSDVPAGHWASGYVGTAAKLGIVNGVGNGQFAPEAPVKYEEAITMLVRALGYEAAAQARGGYPYGYLIVANENGLLDEVKGTQGAPATRGIVAQLTDNALEIPMMVQVGFGSESKWVVSGSKEHGGDEKYLLDEMGFDTYEGRVVSVNTKRNEITLDNEDEDLKLKDKTVKVGEGFDFYEVEGLTIKVWYAKDTAILYTVKDEAKFDAVEYDSKEKEITLITEDENYEVAKGATLLVDGEKVKIDEFEADYAKVVLNDDSEIVWAEGYTFDGFLVVKEVKDDEIKAYGDDELDVEDYLIVKDGKTLAAKDLEDGEVVFYNNNEDFAVVATISKTGKIDRVYSDSFRFEGKTYKFENAKYFDGKNLSDFDKDVLDEVVKDEDEVEAIFNFANKVVLLSGEDKDADASSFYAVLLENSDVTTGRRNEKFLSIDVRTADGSKKAYDLDFDVLDDSKLLKAGKTKFESLDDLKEDTAIRTKGDVIKVKVDKDGDVTEVSIPEKAKITENFKVTKTYVVTAKADYKATSSTVVFYNSNKKAIKLGDIKDEFEVVQKDGYVFYEAGKAVAIVAETDADADTKTVVGLLTAVKELSSGAYEFRVKVAGKSEAYVTESTSFKLPSGIKASTKNVIVVLKVGEKSEKVKTIALADNYETVTIKSVSGRKLTDNAKEEYELVDNYKLYDANDDFAEVRSIRDLVDKKVTLYFDGNSEYYVSYVIVGETSKDDPSDVTGVVTHVNTVEGEEGFVIDKKTTHFIDAKTILTNAKDEVVLMGKAVLTGTDKLLEGDQVEVSVRDGVMTIKRLKKAGDLASEKELADAKKALEIAKEKIDVLKEADYADWSAVEVALALPETDVTEIKDKTLAINNAIAGLEFAGLADLTAKITEAKSKAEETTKYTEESIADLNVEIAKAELAKLAKESNAKIVAATEALEAAIAALVAK